MFAPYCPNHHSRVLLFADNIDSIEKGDEGLTVRFHCTCGYQGIWNPGVLAA
jgi:hypothetical protein